jgi:hypothetical protein
VSVRGPYTDPSQKHRRRTYKGPVRAAWSARGLAATLLTILVVALVIWLAIGK